MTRRFPFLATLFCSASLLFAQAPSPTPAFQDLPTPPPLPQFTPLPLPATAPATPSASPAATPLPDGTLPLPLPPVPTPPPLPDAQQISSELSAPLPPQQAEPLAPGAETQTLKASGREAMTKEMATTNFYKALDSNTTPRFVILRSKRRSPPRSKKIPTSSGRFKN